MSNAGRLYIYKRTRRTGQKHHGSTDVPSNWHLPLHVVMEESDHVRGIHTFAGFSTMSVCQRRRRLSRSVYENHIKWLVLLDRLFLELLHGEYHIYCWSTGSETTLVFRWEITFPISSRLGTAEKCLDGFHNNTLWSLVGDISEVQIWHPLLLPLMDY